EEGVVRGHQVDNAAIAAQHAVDVQFQFLFHQSALIQQATGLRELAAVRSNLVQLGNVKPLERKVVDQRFRSRVCKHSLDLLRHHRRITETRRDSEVEEFLIRQAAPQEKRKARRQFQ